MSSTTTSARASRTSAAASGVTSEGSTPRPRDARTGDGDPDELEPRARRVAQRAGARRVEERTGDLGADGPAAEERDADRARVRLGHGHSSDSRSSDGLAAQHHPRAPRPSRTRPRGVRRGCTSRPSSTRRRRSPACTVRRRSRASEGTCASSTSTSPLSQCLPTTRTTRRRDCGRRARQERLVARAVEHRPRVVAHAAVDRDVGAHAGQRLDRPDRVQREPRRRDDRAAGLRGDAHVRRRRRRRRPRRGPRGPTR